MNIEPTDGFGAKVSFAVTNTGSRPGAEVVQVYVRAVNPKVERPWVELKGYTKIALDVGDAKRAEIQLGVSSWEWLGRELTLQHEAWAYYSVDSKSWVGDAGEYEVRVGTSSLDTAVTTSFSLKQSFSYIGVGQPEAR